MDMGLSSCMEQAQAMENTRLVKMYSMDVGGQWGGNFTSCFIMMNILENSFTTSTWSLN